jgi:hypothetical protein
LEEATLVSSPEWFCAGCAFKDTEHDVRAHARQMRHEFGASEVFRIRMRGVDVTAIGVTGFAAEGALLSYVHANRCPVSSCPSPVLEDDQVLRHMRSHIANGEWQPPR